MFEYWSFIAQNRGNTVQEQLAKGQDSSCVTNQHDQRKTKINYNKLLSFPYHWPAVKPSLPNAQPPAVEVFRARHQRMRSLDKHAHSELKLILSQTFLNAAQSWVLSHSHRLCRVFTAFLEVFLQTSLKFHTLWDSAGWQGGDPKSTGVSTPTHHLDVQTDTRAEKRCYSFTTKALTTLIHISQIACPHLTTSTE